MAFRTIGEVVRVSTSLQLHRLTSRSARVEMSFVLVPGQDRLDVDHGRAVHGLERTYFDSARRSSTSSTLTLCSPMGLGLAGERVANTPEIGR
jgi:hypothetical protein